jgi:RimJ/RimL family protein N-acetyltransferase
MPNLRFVPMDEKQRSIFASWFEDKETARWLGYPDNEWLEYVTRTPDCFAWMVYEGDIPVAEIDYYFDGDEVGGLCFAVNPTLRRQGFARKMLEEFMGREAFKEVRCFRAWVDHENEVSCRLLESSGFTVLVTQPDDQGYLGYVLERN